MRAFEYAMVLISIIVGLGLTHILSSLSSAVHRLRGHGPRIRLEVAYLSWVGFIFNWLVSFWWWEFKWSEATEFGIGLFMFLLLYAVVLFSIAVVLVPHQLSIVDDSWEYFLSIRTWFYGGILLLNFVDLADTFMKGMDWGLRITYLIFWPALTAASIVGLSTTRRSIHAALGLTMLIWTIGLTFYEQAALGGW